MVRDVSDLDPPLALSYDDVLLVPRRSAVGSRNDVDTSSRFSRRITLRMPVVSANMDTVTEAPMAGAMAQVGAIGVIHRFLSIERQVAEVTAVVTAAPDTPSATVGRAGGLAVAAAVGVRADAAERAEALSAAGVDAIVIDVAHGHSEQVMETLDRLRRVVDESVDIVVGNVATTEGATELAAAGADAVKVGVGPGSACTTRVVTGVGVPQLSAVRWCAEVLAPLDVPLIADGGVRAGGDVAKAIAAGADSVMVGNLLARCEESAGAVVEREGARYKTYRGMASHGAAATRPDASGAPPAAAEGVEGVVPLAGSAAREVGRLVGGLRSSMSYAGAGTLPEFRANAHFVRITSGGLRESLPHDLLHDGSA